MRNHLIKESGAVSTQPPLHAHWIIDGMGKVREISPCNTWEEFVISFLWHCMPSPETNAVMLTLTMDVYVNDSVKGAAQAGNNTHVKHIKISSEHQSMPKGKEWLDFLQDGTINNHIH